MARILLVDDDPDVLKIAVQILAQANHHSETALDAFGALNALNRSHFDILITDANMPHHSGYELIQTIRNDKRFDPLAIVMLTGRREKQDIQEALKLGADDYIVKPFDQFLFFQKIELLLQKKPPAQQLEVRFQDTPIQAEVKLKAHLTTLSEVNLTMITDYELKYGQLLELNASLFNDININPPTLKVVSSIPQGSQWLVNLVLVGANESILQKIRAYLYKQSTQKVS